MCVRALLGVSVHARDELKVWAGPGVNRLPTHARFCVYPAALGTGEVF